MNWFTGIVVFLLVWWLTLFAVLPWGIQTEQSADPHIAPGAPANPRLGVKFLITTAIAAIIWLVIFLLIEIGVIDFYAISEKMMKEDRL